MVRREIDSKETYKRKIVDLLEKREKESWTNLKLYFTEYDKIMCKRTMDKYLKELMSENKVTKVGKYYMLSELGEEHWFRDYWTRVITAILPSLSLVEFQEFVKFALDYLNPFMDRHFKDILDSTWTLKPEIRFQREKRRRKKEKK